MKDLIEALTIFSKYTNDDVIHCEHDELFVCVSPDDVSEADKDRLSELSFDDNGDGFTSTRFGSC